MMALQAGIGEVSLGFVSVPAAFHIDPDDAVGLESPLPGAAPESALFQLRFL